MSGDNVHKPKRDLRVILAENHLTEVEYQEILKVLKREPNEVELGLYSAMWSEHCSYKSSRPLLKLFPTQADWVLFGPGENAGVIDIGEGVALVVKIESHNHPSAVEPFHGAATGVGGVVRDVLAMGARPVALLGSLRFGIWEDPQVQYLVQEVARGLAFYSNNIEIPVIGGEISFSECYQENPLVNAMCVGLVKKGDIVVAKAKEIDSIIILAGARTGLDGVGSASFASRELAEVEQVIEHPPIPQGNPHLEKRIIEACLEIVKKGLILGMQDLGAAGLVSSTSEMASKGGNGIELDLSLVPRKEKNITPREMMLSETQERMLLVIRKEALASIGIIFDKWDIEYTVIGKVTSDGLLRLKEGRRIVAEVPAKSLAEGVPVRHYPGKAPTNLHSRQRLDLENISQPEDYNQALLKMISSSNLCSKNSIYSSFHPINASGTEVILFSGDDAGIIKIEGSKKALAFTVDGNGRYCYLDPFLGGMIAVAESARNLSCKGARPLAITDNLNFGNPEKEEIYWQLEEAIKGISKAARFMEIPVISGNVSLNNESNGEAIYPTPVIGMVGLIEDFNQICTLSFKKDGDLVVLLGENREELGGSEYLKVFHNLEKGTPPQLDLNLEKSVHKVCRESILQGILSSAHDCSEGGLIIALAECCLSGEKGIRINKKAQARNDALLFGESQSCVIVSLSPDKLILLQDIAVKHQVPIEVLGEVEGESLIFGDLVDLGIEQIRKTWEGNFINA